MNAFARAVADADPRALHATAIDTLMLNVGLRCDQACAHCHQSCSPARTELMSRDVMDAALVVADTVRPALVDITGGAPELNPHLGYLLTRLHEGGHPIRLRTNLTALLSEEAEGLVELLVQVQAGVLASLPGTSAEEVAAQRGPVFDRALEALRRLAGAGYGTQPALWLGIAVNQRADAPLDPATLEQRFRAQLTGGLGIPFDELVLITNVPVGRFRQQLRGESNLDGYVRELRGAFNSETLPRLACRTCIVVAWDGTLADCDFNLGSGVPLARGLPRHVSEFDASVLTTRPVRFAEHCFACAADAGSG